MSDVNIDYQDALIAAGAFADDPDYQSEYDFFLDGLNRDIPDALPQQLELFPEESIADRF